jgi:toxin ParE1/3/4
MIYRLTILDPAHEDTLDAFDWYKMQSEFAAAYFLERIDEAFKIITETPLIYQIIYRNFRQVILNPFPYVIIYEATASEVIVYRVWHASRNPRKKFKPK